MGIPAIIMGKEKHSCDELGIYDYKGNELDKIEIIPSIMLTYKLQEQKESYREASSEKLLEIIKAAGTILMNEIINKESVEDYYLKYSLSTGLPYSVGVNGLRAISEKMINIEKIVKSEVPKGQIGCLDTGLVEEEYNKLAVAKEGQLLGVIAPSNHPAVHISWITALALKYSVVVKPGRDDPYTPMRIVRALIIAGINPHLLSVIPMEHHYIKSFIKTCDKTIVYGNKETVKLFDEQKIISRSEGNSKVFISMSEGYEEEEALSIAFNSVLHDGGKRCTNASMIVVKGGSARDFAYKLAKKFSQVKIMDPTDEKAMVGCFKDLQLASKLNDFIDNNLGDAEDVTLSLIGKERLVKKGAYAFLRPTVIYCPTPKSTLLNNELPFPFVTVIGGGEGDLKGGLAVSLVNTSKEVATEILRDPHNSRVIINGPTYKDKVGSPHDGSLFHKLYKTKAYIE